MPTILLTHTPDMLANSYGERALKALRALGEVRLNETSHVLDARALADAARGCEIVVSDRQTAGPAEFFAQAPDLVAFLRVAVDIRNIDVKAASAQGVLVTHATPGFTAAVAEMAIGFMVDCGRHVSVTPPSTTKAACRRRAWPPAQRRHARHHRLWRDRRISRGPRARLRHVGAGRGSVKKVSATGLTQVTLPDLLARADFVVCLAIANEATENLMNAEAFATISRRPISSICRAAIWWMRRPSPKRSRQNVSPARRWTSPRGGPDAFSRACAPRRRDRHAAQRRADARRRRAPGLRHVHQVEALVAGRMPEGAANAERRTG